VNEDLRIGSETENFAENEELISSIPHSLSQSPYRISLEELEGLLEIANLAPSGGNIQPWIWIMDKKGNLHLFHDKKRSESMLDYLGTGSLIAFGAALENFRLIAATRGFEIEIINQIKEFEQTLIASIRFIAKYSKPILVPHFELVDGIKLRCTNRKNNDRVLLDQQILKQFEQYALEEGLELSFIEDESKLSQLAKVVGGMDRMRFFHEQGLVDFIKEVRWTQKDAIETKDGIDIETLELGATERAAMGLLKDPRTVKFFRKFFLGYGLTKISKDTMMTASSIGMIRSENFDPISYLKAGAALQRIWIKANMKQISFQPVAAMCFMFHFVKREKENGFSQSEINEIKSLEKTTDLIFGSSKYCEPIFMFRLNVAGEPSIRSYRREVKDTLIII
ncbi:MAG: hypothetical protein LPJ98_09035, partial [Cyclobacteriaceae bacterium]|nr:hypothetical protein [Cyclobacteriaceae bacterium]